MDKINVAMHLPAIDVVVPLYRNEQYAVAAVNSALTQTYPVAKVIVVDDGSPDRSADILEDAFALEERVEIIRAAHGGLPYARNIGIRASSAPYLAFLDSDDLWHPSKVERQMAEFLANDDVSLVYCRFHDIDADGAPLPSKPFALASDDVHHALLLGNALSGGSAAAVRRRSLDLTGPFDETLSYAEDWDMWLRLSSVGTCVLVDEDLLSVRRHGLQMSAKGRRGKRYRILVQHLTIWSKWGQEIERSVGAQKALVRQIIATALRSGPGARRRAQIFRASMGRVRKLFGPRFQELLFWRSILLVPLIAIEKLRYFLGFGKRR